MKTETFVGGIIAVIAILSVFLMSTQEQQTIIIEPPQTPEPIQAPQEQPQIQTPTITQPQYLVNEAAQLRSGTLMSWEITQPGQYQVSVLMDSFVIPIMFSTQYDLELGTQHQKWNYNKDCTFKTKDRPQYEKGGTWNAICNLQGGEVFAVINENTKGAIIKVQIKEIN